MAVPNTFSTATSAIPLANLDANFAYYDGAFSISGTATTFTGSVTLTSGTANGVTYLNGSKVLTSGSALTFDGTNLAATASTTSFTMGNTTGFGTVTGAGTNGGSITFSGATRATYPSAIQYAGTTQIWYNESLGTERMRLDSTGLGIGTSSPAFKLDVTGTGSITGELTLGNDVKQTSDAYVYCSNGGGVRAGFLLDGTNAAVKVFTAGTQKAIIDSSGNVGIGTSSPGAKLDIVGNLTIGASTAATTYGLQLTQTSGADRDVFLAGVLTVSNGFTVRYVSSAMQYTMSGLGTGTVTSTSGVLSAVSDQNMKVADGEIENAIDKVLSLKPRYFYWKDKDGNADTAKRRQLGFYAQEVNAVVPEASPEPIKEDDGWGVYDRSLVATLVKAIQEQQALITSLTARITALEST